MKDILKYGIFAGLWGVLLIPFFVTNGMFFPYIVGKNFAFRIIVEIIFALYLILAINYREYRPKFSWILISVSIFTFIMLVADIFAVNPSKALWSNYERMDGFVTLAHLWAYLVVFGSIMKNRESWVWFLKTSVAFSFIMALKTLFGKEAEALTRISGPLGNPIYIGVYFLFNTFFVTILLYIDVIKKRMSDSWYVVKEWLRDWMFYVYAVLAFLNVWGIWKTQTRGVILGLLGGLVVTFLITAIWGRKGSLLKKISIIKIVAIVIIVVGFIFIKDSSLIKKNPTLSRLSGISWSNVTGQGQARQYVWPMAIKGFSERPILGWGQDGFNYIFNKNYDPRMYGHEQWFDRAHNMPLDILVAGGVLGFLSYLSIFVACLYILWKSKIELFSKAILVGLISAYFFQNLFVFDNLISYVLFFVILSYLYFLETEDKKPLLKDFEISENMRTVVSIIIVLFFGFLVWFINIRALNANTTLIKALVGQEYDFKEKKVVNLTTDETMNYFKKALAYNTFGNMEIREQLLQKAQRVGYSDASEESKLSYINFAIEEMNRQIVETPQDTRPYIFLGSFFNILGKPDLAIEKIEKAKELSPNKQSIGFELIQAYINNGDFIKARDEAKRIYELDKSHKKAESLYIATLILSGDEKTAYGFIGEEGNSDDSITRAYVIRAIQAYERGIYSQAVSEINKAIKLNPSFEENGKQIIQGIWSGRLEY